MDTEGPSDYDRANIGVILRGEGDWFSAQLLRLIAKADDRNRAKLAQVFPQHVDAVNEYRGWPKRDQPVSMGVERAESDQSLSPAEG